MLHAGLHDQPVIIVCKARTQARKSNTVIHGATRATILSESIGTSILIFCIRLKEKAGKKTSVAETDRRALRGPQRGGEGSGGEGREGESTRNTQGYESLGLFSSEIVVGAPFQFSGQGKSAVNEAGCFYDVNPPFTFFFAMQNANHKIITSYLQLNFNFLLFIQLILMHIQSQARVRYFTEIEVT